MVWSKIKNALIKPAAISGAMEEIRLVDLGVPKPLARFWANYTRRQVQFMLNEAQVEDNTPVANTKFGGSPDLPGLAHWPVSSPYPAKGRNKSVDARPLEFLCQINMADVVWAQSEDLPIPKTGLLSVFYDNEEQPWGYDPAQASGARMIYTPLGSSLQRIDGQSFGFASNKPVCTVTTKNTRSLPDYTGLHTLIERDGGAQGEALSDLLEEFYDEDEAIHDINSWSHSFGGWPVHIQSEFMQEECQLASNGIECGEPEAYKTDKAKALLPGAIDWRTVLQLDCEDQLEWHWGSSGRLYWWARQADIAVGGFEKSWTVLQCT
jgi:uncharacterized protein YwqG